MSSSPLKQAFANTQRSYLSAKQRVGQNTENLFSHGPAGLPTDESDLYRSQDQLRHFKDWVFAAIRPVAQTIAGQPIHVGHATADTAPGRSKSHQPVGVEPYKNHPLLDLFHGPNGLMTPWSLMFVSVASLELTGRQLLWLPDREQILPVPTSWIRRIEADTHYHSFRVQPPFVGEDFAIPADECVYISYPSPADPHAVTSPLQAAAGGVNADEAILQSQNSSFRRGIYPSHALIVGKNAHSEFAGGRRPSLSPAQQRQIITAIKKRYEHMENHGEPLILDSLIEDVKELSVRPGEMNWLESGKTTKNRILQGFGVNPIIAGEIEGANRASATVAAKHFIQHKVNPLIELLSQTLTKWLRPMFGEEIVVWVEKAVPDDSEMKLKWATQLAKLGFLTGDEMRNLAPFGLESGRFAEAAPQPQRSEEDELQEAMAELQEAVGELKGAEASRSQAFAERILSETAGTKSNGRF